MVDTATEPLEELLHELPPLLRLEVRNFVKFLLTKHQTRVRCKLRQDWAGTVQNGAYTSVDLQHYASTLRDL